MKNKSIIPAVVTLFFMLILILTDSVFGINNSKSIKNFSEAINVSDEIAIKRASSDFKTVNFFQIENNSLDFEAHKSIISHSVFMELRKDVLKKLFTARYENILFQIPISSTETIELEMTQTFPVSEDFKVFFKSGNVSEKPAPGLFYRGIIKGKEKSLAAVSIFNNFVMGIISDERGNFVLGALKNPDKSFSDKYVFYNDADLNIKSKFKCSTPDYDQDLNNSNKNITGKNNHLRLPVRIYFEADYQTYLDGGSSLQNVTDFILGFFNSVAAIYKNESLIVEVSAIGVWDVPDPYINLFEPPDILQGFGEINQDNFPGNLAHLISTRTDNLGGIAWLRVLCMDYNPDNYSGRFAFSNIEPGYNDFPTFSWTVDVVAHEMGHNFGSKHTHACVWPLNGTIQAIDSCYNAEGTCFTTPHASVGTIMSYCYLWAPEGEVNFSLGFGPLPGDTIRLRYEQAECLDRYLNSSEAPVSFSLSQNFPNPFNPSTVISYQLPQDEDVSLIVYGILGNEIVELINKRQSAGNYSVKFEPKNLSSGIYFYKIQAGNFFTSKKMLLIK